MEIVGKQQFSCQIQGLSTEWAILTFSGSCFWICLMHLGQNALWSLSWWKVYSWKVYPLFCPSLKSFADCKRHSFRILLYLSPSILVSTLTSFPVCWWIASHNIMLPPPCFTVEMMFSWWWAWEVLCFHRSQHFVPWPKSSILASSDQRTIFHTFAESGFQTMAVQWQAPPIWAMDLAISSRVTFGLLIHHLCLSSVFLVGSLS